MSWLPGHPIGFQCVFCLKMTASSQQPTHFPLSSAAPCGTLKYGEETGPDGRVKRMMEMPIPSTPSFCSHCASPMDYGVGNLWAASQPQGFVSSLPASPHSTCSSIPDFDVPANLDLNNVDLSDCDFSDCNRSVTSNFSGGNEPIFAFTEEELKKLTSYSANNVSHADMMTPGCSAASMASSLAGDSEPVFAFTEEDLKRFASYSNDNNTSGSGLMTPGSSTASVESSTPVHEDGFFGEKTPTMADFPPHLTPQFFTPSTSDYMCEMDVDQDPEDSMVPLQTPITALPLGDPSTPMLRVPRFGGASRPSPRCPDLDFLKPENQSTDLSGFAIDTPEESSPITPRGPCSSPASAVSDDEEREEVGSEIAVYSTSLLDTLHDIQMELDEEEEWGSPSAGAST
jgi:hypothetical protein